MNWLHKQWNDIKGNVKYALILLVGSGIVTGVLALTHGLQLWQQLLLGMAFILLFGWAMLLTGTRKAFEVSSRHLAGRGRIPAIGRRLANWA